MASKRELQDFIEGLIEGDLTAAEHKHFCSILKGDREARRLYIAEMKIHGMLRWELRPVEDETDLPSPAPLAFSSRKSSIPHWLIAVAAILVLSLCSYLVLQGPQGSSGPKIAESADDMSPFQVARITGLRDVTGLETQRPAARLGDRLPEGLVQLKTGVAEITFDSGVVVTLEGPASFRLDAQNRGSLQYGKLVAVVPKQAIGFIVSTKNHIIKDMGTVFAIEASENGDGEVHVIDGWVAFSSKGDSGIRDEAVHKGETIRFVHDNAMSVERIPFHPEGFIQPSVNGSLRLNYNHVHFSFDEGAESRVADDGQGFRDGPFMGEFAGQPKWIEGAFGNALRFDGIDDCIPTTFSGISGQSTIAFWTKISPDASRDDAYAILSWGRKVVEGQKWVVMWNAKKLHGNLGAVKVSLEGAHLVGTTDLRDGLWHHVAIVYHGGDSKLLASQMLLYVDGALESITGSRTGVTVDTATRDQDAVKMQIGRYMEKTERFAGALDEIYVFDVALTPKGIMDLKTDNRVPQQ